jgi:hypothetical protein
MFADGGFVNEPDGVMNFADGGYVPQMSAMGGYGMEDTLGPMGAMDMAGGIGMPDPMRIEYDQYMQGAEKLGLPAIPFEQFVELKQMSIPQAPEAPGMEQPYGAMGFAAGGMVQTKNQFGYQIDPQTGRSPIGQAAMDRYSAAVAGNNALRQQAAAPQQAQAPQAPQAQAPQARQAPVSQWNNPNPGYGQLAQSAGLNTSMVQGARDAARMSGGVASFGDGLPSLMDKSRMGGNQFGFADGGMINDPAFQSRQSVIAMARGGGVDASGKMVMDTNPNAPTDSIPAMIDGKQPAALDSGEFVIPKHVVMYHGIDKLNKLIAQAEKGPTNGANA